MGERSRCAVLGDPIEHSLSPVLHRAGYDHLGLSGSYDAHRVGEDELAGFLAGLDRTWRGLSLTMPLKRVAIGLADRVSARAALAGAANTLVLADDGRTADNTDIPGAVAALRERYDGPVRSATILGGGATATSTGLALVELGAREVTLAVRTPERAAETAAVLRSHPDSPAVTVVALADFGAHGDVLVSTVPAAAQSTELVERCRAFPVVFEVLYHPWPTPLAASVGADRTLVGGLDLLVHQASVQFRLFTGEDAPVDVMRAAGEEALVDRSAG